MYLYFCGHQNQLAENEFWILTGKKATLIEDKWLSSDEYLDVNLSGNLVFCLEILDNLEGNSGSKVVTQLTKRFEQTARVFSKKIGVCNLIPVLREKEVINLFKDFGGKKINTISTIPTFGNFKHTKNWVFLLPLADKIYIAELKNHFNQEFWADLDINLPQKNLKIGIINLKLAKFLTNLSTNSKVWDPFCGFGRNLLVGLGLKTDFVGSDLNPNCVNWSQENFDFAKKYFDLEVKPVETEKFFVAASSDLEAVTQNTSGLDLSQFSVVSEGSLGHNFEAKPNPISAKNEWENLLDLWSGNLKTFAKFEIKEVVFCLPFFDVLEPKFIQNSLESLIENSNYVQFEFLNSQKFLVYKRPQAFVGHLIVKLEKNR
jgi:RNA recognition motif-containing protein